ncbi:hypothetical protein ONZ45_g17936 [Pleurotus djamor]|nr:hypothetical protein ONZ45_g17936 [Pleurotus djamor]
MAEQHVNMFSGSPLNRLSWLRSSHLFLNAVVPLPTTKWLLFNAGQPLVSSTFSSGKIEKKLAYLSTQDVRPLLGEEPFFGQGEKEGDVVPVTQPDASGHTPESPLDAIRHRGIPLVFLGVKETHVGSSALPSSEFADPGPAVANLKGEPYFSMDVADADDGIVKKVLSDAGKGKEGVEYGWFDSRSVIGIMDAFDAAVYAGARSLVDWNYRNKFCPGCGSPNYSQWGGWKLSCKSLIPWVDSKGRKACLTVKGLHNYTHPRTDPVVIMVAVDETGEKILLGRNRKFPGKFYSALAGFIEPGESFEDAVVREMWEEAGVQVWNVTYHSGQPWPYPANLMVGYYARADSSKPIRVDLDNELEDARWYSRDEILAVFNHPTGTGLTARDNKAINERIDNRDNRAPAPAPGQSTSAEIPDAWADNPSGGPKPPVIPTTHRSEPPFKMPPVTAIAGVLIRDWALGKVKFDPLDLGSTRKPNL